MGILKAIKKLVLNEEVKKDSKKTVNIEGLFNPNFNKKTIVTPTKISDFKYEHIRALTICDNNEIDKPFTGYLAAAVDYYAFTKVLLELGLIKIADDKETLAGLKVTELKEILKSLNLKFTGKKQDLIDRIVSNCSDGEISGLNIRKTFVHTELGKKVIEKRREELSEAEYGKFAIAIDLILNGGFSIAYDIICKDNMQKPTRNFMYDWSDAYSRGLSKEDEKRYANLFKINSDKNIVACAIYSSMSGDSINKITNYYIRYTEANTLNTEEIEKISQELGSLKDSIQAKVRTISTRDANKREIASYKNAGIQKYIFVATLDKKTCPVCGSLDSKIFKVSDAKDGVNLPPMHEGCRCTTRAYFDGMKRGPRRARDPLTYETYLIDNMSYEEWSKIYLKGVQ